MTQNQDVHEDPRFTGLPGDDFGEPIIEVVDLVRTYTMGDNVVQALAGVSFRGRGRLVLDHHGPIRGRASPHC